MQYCIDFGKNKCLFINLLWNNFLFEKVVCISKLYYWKINQLSLNIDIIKIHSIFKYFKDNLGFIIRN